MIYKTVILGCGNIAGGYDTPTDNYILTHAHAIQRSEFFDLSGVFDIDKIAGEKFASKWDTYFYESYEQLFEVSNPDIVVIATPNHVHSENLKLCLSYKPMAVICEKPLGLDFHESSDIIKSFKSAKIPLAVNYTRRYDTFINNLKNDISKKKFGEFVNSSALYSKGIVHNGSHMVNLLTYLFGEIKSFEILNHIIDYSEADPTLDMFLKFDFPWQCHLIASNEQNYTLFELDLLFSEKRIKLINCGMKYQQYSVITDPLYPNYKEFDDGKVFETGMKDSMVNLYRNIYNHLKNDELLLCSGDDALRTNSYCINFLSEYQKKL